MVHLSSGGNDTGSPPQMDFPKENVILGQLTAYRNRDHHLRLITKTAETKL